MPKKVPGVCSWCSCSGVKSDALGAAVRASNVIVAVSRVWSVECGGEVVTTREDDAKCYR